LSPEMVSKITDRIAPEIKEWQQRRWNYIHVCFYGWNSLDNESLKFWLGVLN